MAVSGQFRSAAEKERFIQATFSTIAGCYDGMNRVMTFSLDRRWRRYTVQLSGMPAGGRALDVCCGTGELARALAERTGPAGRVTGLDFNREMLQIAKRKQEQGLLADSIDFVQGNAMALPFPDNQFDTATIGFGLRNVPDYRQVLREMRRVVRPGGTVVSLETGKPTLPVFKSLHGLYVGLFVPLIDRLAAGKNGPYAWLASSAEAFLPQEALAQVFREIGLDNVFFRNIFGGAAAVHVGVKS
ncbi:MAG: demethylmenaquinone methyltransferase [Heliobacteriaceae bacterium]|nr:demethylmenaquinone methyltransferase [Heliobacteriaceae bacterium]MDD4587387.1 demethylmenaquinone methyltransferase [Heliobacteriaceae bacterium]